MIIFLSGSINSGKSTVAKLLSKKLEKVAVVEIDSLRDFISDVKLEDSIPINLENAVSVTKNFVRHEFNVIVPYPLTQKNYEFMVNELIDLYVEVFFFTLSPSLAKSQSDTDTRKLTDWEKERIKYHYDIGIANPKFGEMIDSTNQSPEETTLEILSRINYLQRTV